MYYEFFFAYTISSWQTTIVYCQGRQKLMLQLTSSSCSLQKKKERRKNTFAVYCSILQNKIKLFLCWTFSAIFFNFSALFIFGDGKVSAKVCEVILFLRKKRHFFRKMEVFNGKFIIYAFCTLFFHMNNCNVNGESGEEGVENSFSEFFLWVNFPKDAFWKCSNEKRRNLAPSFIAIIYLWNSFPLSMYCLWNRKKVLILV